MVPSPISFMVSVEVKHHVYLLTRELGLFTKSGSTDEYSCSGYQPTVVSRKWKSGRARQTWSQRKTARQQSHLPRKEDLHQSSPGATHWEGRVPLFRSAAAGCGDETKHRPQPTQYLHIQQGEAGICNNLKLRSWPNSWTLCSDAHLCRRHNKMCSQQQSVCTPSSTAAKRNWRRRSHSFCRLDSQCSGDLAEGELNLYHSYIFCVWLFPRPFCRFRVRTDAEISVPLCCESTALKGSVFWAGVAQNNYTFACFGCCLVAHNPCSFNFIFPSSLQT